MALTVAATAPTVKLSAGSAKLNRYLAGNEYLNVKVTLKNGTGYTVTDFEGMPDGMSYDEESGILTGTLLEVGFGKRSAESVQEVLDAKDRKLAGYTAPPQGLCLMRVDY